MPKNDSEAFERKRLFFESSDIAKLLGPGVYIIRNSDHSVLYVGASKCVGKRIFGRHHVLSEIAEPFTMEVIICEDEKDAIQLERDRIKNLRPKLNSQNPGAGKKGVCIRLSKEARRVIDEQCKLFNVNRTGAVEMILHEIEEIRKAETFKNLPPERVCPPVEAP